MAQYPATGVPSSQGTTNVQAPPAAMALGGRQRFIHDASAQPARWIYASEHKVCITYELCCIHFLKKLKHVHHRYSVF